MRLKHGALIYIMLMMGLLPTSADTPYEIAVVKYYPQLCPAILKAELLEFGEEIKN